jgi:hypothetical protein
VELRGATSRVREAIAEHPTQTSVGLLITAGAVEMSPLPSPAKEAVAAVTAAAGVIMGGISIAVHYFDNQIRELAAFDPSIARELRLGEEADINPRSQPATT